MEGGGATFSFYLAAGTLKSIKFPLRGLRSVFSPLVADYWKGRAGMNLSRFSCANGGRGFGPGECSHNGACALLKDCY